MAPRPTRALEPASPPTPHVPTRHAPSLPPPPQRSRLLEANFLQNYTDRAAERSRKGLKDEVLQELRTESSTKQA